MASIPLPGAVNAARTAAAAATKSYRTTHRRGVLGGSAGIRLHPRGEVGPCLVRLLHRSAQRNDEDGNVGRGDSEGGDPGADAATFAAVAAAALPQAGPSTPRSAPTPRKGAADSRKEPASESQTVSKSSQQNAPHANLSDEDLLKARSIAQGQVQQRDASARASSSTAERIWAPQSGAMGTDGQPVGQFQGPRPQIVQGEFTSRREKIGSGKAEKEEAGGSSSTSDKSVDQGPISPENAQVSPSAESLEAPVLRPPRVEHPFNTREFVQRLQEGGWLARKPARSSTHGSSPLASDGEIQIQAMRKHDPAEALMEATRFLLRTRGDSILQSMLTKSDLENEAYLFSAALSELRTELSVRARNDGAALRSLMTLLQREVDSLQQRMSEDIASLKHDIQVDMNNRKNEAKEEQNLVDQEIQDLNNRFTISLSDLKTEIEQNIKWDATRRALALVFGIAAIVAATLAAADHLTRDVDDKKGKKDEDLSDEAKAAAMSDASITLRARTAEELGLVPKYDIDGNENLRAV